MTNNKQSSLELFAIAIYEKFKMEGNGKELNDLLEHYKPMHKEEIIDSFGVGCQVEASRLIGYHKMAEQYYKEEFGEK